MTKVTINTKTIEQTYKAGDFFLISGKLNMLAHVDAGNSYALIHVKSGNRWDEPISVLNTAAVTQEELNKMAQDVNIQYIESVDITY